MMSNQHEMSNQYVITWFKRWNDAVLLPKGHTANLICLLENIINFIKTALSTPSFMKLYLVYEPVNELLIYFNWQMRNQLFTESIRWAFSHILLVRDDCRRLSSRISLAAQCPKKLLECRHSNKFYMITVRIFGENGIKWTSFIIILRSMWEIDKNLCYNNIAFYDKVEYCNRS